MDVLPPRRRAVQKCRLCGQWRKGHHCSGRQPGEVTTKTTKIALTQPTNPLEIIKAATTSSQKKQMNKKLELVEHSKTLSIQGSLQKNLENKTEKFVNNDHGNTPSVQISPAKLVATAVVSSAKRVEASLSSRHAPRTTRTTSLRKSSSASSVPAPDDDPAAGPKHHLTTKSTIIQRGRKRPRADDAPPLHQDPTTTMMMKKKRAGSGHRRPSSVARGSSRASSAPLSAPRSAGWWLNPQGLNKTMDWILQQNQDDAEDEDTSWHDQGESNHEEEESDSDDDQESTSSGSDEGATSRVGKKQPRKHTKTTRVRVRQASRPNHHRLVEQNFRNKQPPPGEEQPDDSIEPQAINPATKMAAHHHWPSTMSWTQVLVPALVLREEVESYIHHYLPRRQHLKEATRPTTEEPAEANFMVADHLRKWIHAIERRLYQQNTLVLENMRLTQEHQQRLDKVQSLRQGLVALQAEIRHARAERERWSQRLAQSQQQAATQRAASRFLENLDRLRARNSGSTT